MKEDQLKTLEIVKEIESKFDVQFLSVYQHTYYF